MFLYISKALVKVMEGAKRKATRFVCLMAIDGRVFIR